jgi:hypothetical protein
MADQNLKSLNTFLDVVFALMFFRIIEYLPPFEDKHWTQLPHGLLSLLAGEPANLTRVGFGVIIVVYYWSRKNSAMSLIGRANGIFTTLAIASVFFLCLFMWALVADPRYVGGPPTLLLQSASLFVASLLGLLALHYAIRAGLTPPELKPSAEQFARVDLSNPLTALIATGLSWSGLTIWSLSWFILMPLLSTLLARLPRKAV